ncbi:MAG: DUF5060 domain-containing protein [Akkermansiaceae bacterium]|nr:DUF5060 domain-containing protein [Akkermansiaceae bacterium]
MKADFGFNLVKPGTSQIIRRLSDGDEVISTTAFGIFLAAESTDNLDFFESSKFQGISSVFFELTGGQSLSRSEKQFPFSLAGDIKGAAAEVSLGPGVYTLAATYKLSGSASTRTEQVNFRVVDPSAPPEPPVAANFGFDLIAPGTSNIIQQLKEGDEVISSTSFGIFLGAQSGSEFELFESAEGKTRVLFELTGSTELIRTEKQFPFSLAGDTKGAAAAVNLASGSYTLKATFKLVGASSTSTEEVNFSVADIQRPLTISPTKLKQWHPARVTFQGPRASDEPGSNVNPFLQYRCTAVFSHQDGSTVLTIPCHFAGDGEAAYTNGNGFSSGNVWRAYFNPIKAGAWSYSIEICEGEKVSVEDDATCSQIYTYSGNVGNVAATAHDKNSPDFKKRGIMKKAPESHFYHFGDDETDIFLRNGVGSPENILNYHEFDNTPDPNERSGARPKRGTKQHQFPKYVSLGDDSSNPFWGQNRDKGAGIFGAINYLTSLGANSQYMLTTNLGGDGDDVFVYSSPEGAGDRDDENNKQAAISFENRQWFDVSKLDQWTNLFEHMESKGMSLHLLFQEAETDQILDNGDLGPDRKLYYRELVSRFAHFNALIWNHGVENGNTVGQRKDFFNFVSSLDPYDHPNVIHNWPSQLDSVLQPLLGFQPMSGPSIQRTWNQVYEKVVEYYFESESEGNPWVLAVDETGPSSIGVPTDTYVPSNDNPDTAAILREVLWGTLLGGGDGMSAYFGYLIPDDDLDAEDFNTREAFFTSVTSTLSHFKSLGPVGLVPDTSYDATLFRVTANADSGTHVVQRVSCPSSTKKFVSDMDLSKSVSTKTFYAYTYDSENDSKVGCHTVGTGKLEIDFRTLGIDLCSGARVAVLSSTPCSESPEKPEESCPSSGRWAIADWNLDELIGKNFLFYEAQETGTIRANDPDLLERGLLP